MAWKLPALGVVGVLILAGGLYLVITRRSQLYPGLVIAIGCSSCAVFLLINHPIWSRPDR